MLTLNVLKILVVNVDVHLWAITRYSGNSMLVWVLWQFYDKHGELNCPVMDFSHLPTFANNRNDDSNSQPTITIHS